jgi:hypothetical protein
MDMQVYVLHVVPIVIIVYGAFVLFMHPPVRVIGATLAGGLVMALLNAIGDLAAIHTSVWYYNASGLVAQLPLPFYTTSIFILGGLAYLLIWRYQSNGRSRLARVLLFGVPVLGFLRDLWQAQLGTQGSFLVWQSPLAGVVNLVMWAIMFFAGYVVLRWLAPVQKTEATFAQAESTQTSA